MRWLKSRCCEASTWNGVSHWLVIAGLLTFNWNGNWRTFVWAAAVTAMIAVVVREAEK